MNNVLAEILRTREVMAPSGERYDLLAGVHPSIGTMLQTWVRRVEARTAIEVGFAQGISTLYICEALLEVSPTPRHIVIDPYETEAWHGTGNHNVTRAGYESIVEFHEHPSHRVLPYLELHRTSVDFAFIDGHHAFEYVLVDFFYVDKMLRVGGVVVLDDLQMPAIAKLCRFILKNQNYSLVDAVVNETRHGHDVGEPLCSHCGEPIDRAVLRPEVLDPNEALGIPNGSRSIALRKASATPRPFNEFLEF